MLQKKPRKVCLNAKTEEITFLFFDAVKYIYNCKAEKLSVTSGNQSSNRAETGVKSKSSSKISFLLFVRQARHNISEPKHVKSSTFVGGWKFTKIKRCWRKKICEDGACGLIKVLVVAV